jgi:tetratricopeptide (TPR) repeat protein
MTARALLALLSLALVAGCGPSGAAGISLEAGQRATAAHALRPALAHFRAAAAAAPDYAPAHLARGQAAETLGEFDEALAAYRTAAVLSPGNRVALGTIADRMGQTALALETLDGAEAPWRRHALTGGLAGAVVLGACVPSQWPNAAALLRVCVPAAVTQGRETFETSRDYVAAYRLQILVENGQRERAIDLARARGWVREGRDFCAARDLPVSSGVAALLAMLLQPQRADCVLESGADAGDDGLARLGRLMLRDRIEHSTRADVREQAARVLQYKLPAEDPAKLAESLNVVGWRLQHRHKSPAEAVTVFQKAIAADPAFSWPYHNIGRVYMDQQDHERAREWLMKAVDVNPNHWRAQFSLGVTMHKLQRYDEALAVYTRAAGMNPDDPDTHANLGWVLIKLGRRTEAIRELQIAVQLDPALDAERRYLAETLGHGPRQGATPFSLR